MLKFLAWLLGSILSGLAFLATLMIGGVRISMCHYVGALLVGAVGSGLGVVLYQEISQAFPKAIAYLSDTLIGRGILKNLNRKKGE